MILFTIPGIPITKKNHQKIAINKKTGNPLIVQSGAYLAYEKAAGYFLPPRGWEKAINYPVNVCCVYYMPNKRRVDLTNLLAATNDILVKYGILKDDNCNIVVSHDGSRVLYDKENPRVEIEIREINEDGR